MRGGGSQSATNFVMRSHVNPPFCLRRRLWRSLHRVVAVPVSIGLATLMVAVGTSSFCTSGASPSAGASGWSLSSRAAPGWRCSHCAPQAKFGHHNSAAPRGISMPRWWQSRVRSPGSGRAISTRAGHRFDGRPETQPRAGTIRAGARNGKKEANQPSIRSTAAAANCRHGWR